MGLRWMWAKVPLGDRIAVGNKDLPWRQDMEMSSILQALCESNPSVSNGLHSQRASNAELWYFYQDGHYSDVIMSAMASQITDVSIVCSNIGPGADQRIHQSSASLSFVRGIHRWPGNFRTKRSVTRKMCLFQDVNIVAPEMAITVTYRISRIYF